MGIVIHEGHMIAIGIDLGGTNIKGALVKQGEGILDQVSIPTEADQGRDHVLDRVATLVHELSQKTDQEVDAVGIGVPGMVNRAGDIVSYPPNFPGWKEEPVPTLLQERVHRPCFMGNDANLAALGCARFGVGLGYDDFIMITLGTGVGGGIIMDRHLYVGPHGSAAELGHVVINYHGPLSNSNTRGGIEAYLGQRFLSRFAADLIRQHPENPLQKYAANDFEGLDPLALYEEAVRGNVLAIDILKQSGEKLGYAIVNYIHVLDIRTIVVSGGVARAGDYLLEPARETARKYLMPPFREGFDILYEPLSNEAAMLGAASLAMESCD